MTVTWVEAATCSSRLAVLKFVTCSSEVDHLQFVTCIGIISDESVRDLQFASRRAILIVFENVEALFAQRVPRSV